MAKLKAVYDTHPDVPEQGVTFYHCGQCNDEKPDGVSPKQWARQQLAITETGNFQLWCNRHECNIALIRFEMEEEPALE